MHTAIKNHLSATVCGTGVPAALRALHNLYGLTGSEIAFSLGRDRTRVSQYLNGRQAMPDKVRARLRDALRDCLAMARTVKTSAASEDELLEAIMNRTEELISDL